MKNENMSTCAGGGGPAEQVAERHPYLNPGDCTSKPAKPASGCVVPEPVRVSETGRARNWTIPPLRPERECREHCAEQNDLVSFCERRNSATIDNRCVEFDRRENQRKAGFTMAEILLSLTIIGVVAAITLPSLTGNINERTWNTQRKALYARFSQAIALMPSLNGYGTLTEGTESVSAVDTAAETFVTEGLSKVLKINNICDSEHLKDCGIPAKLTTLTGSAIDIANSLNTLFSLNQAFSSATGYLMGNYSQINTMAAAFETINGESILVYYNPKCTGPNVFVPASHYTGTTYYVQPRMCANFIYDLNGNKGPNTVGKDIGVMTALYPFDPVLVAPMPISKPTAATTDKAGSACFKLDNESRVPSLEELSAMYYNKNLFGLDFNYYWSSTPYSDTKQWGMFDNGDVWVWDKNTSRTIRCIKR